VSEQADSCRYSTLLASSMGKKKGAKAGSSEHQQTQEKEDLDRDSKLKEIVSIQSIEEPEDAVATSKDFIPSSGISTFEANELLLKYGRNELEDKSTPKVRMSPLPLHLPFFLWALTLLSHKPTNTHSGSSFCSNCGLRCPL